MFRDVIIAAVLILAIISMVGNILRQVEVLWYAERTVEGLERDIEEAGKEKRFLEESIKYATSSGFLEKERKRLGIE